MTVTGCLYFKSPLTFTPVKELGSHMQQGQELPATKHYTEHEGWGGARGCGKLTRLRSAEKATTKARCWGHSDQDHLLENSRLVNTADLSESLSMQATIDLSLRTLPALTHCSPYPQNPQQLKKAFSLLLDFDILLPSAKRKRWERVLGPPEVPQHNQL